MSRDQNVLLFLGVLCTLLVTTTGCGGGRKPEVIVKPNVRVFQGAAAPRIARDAEGVLTLDRSADVQAGQVLVLAEDARLVRVVALRSVPSGTSFQYENAKLTDVFERARIRAQIPITDTGFLEEDHGNREPSRTVTATIPIRFNNTDVTVGSVGKVLLSGQADVRLQVDFDMSIEGSRVTYCHTALVASSNPHLEFNIVGASGSRTLKQLPLFQTVVPVGPVPVHVSGQVTLSSRAVAVTDSLVKIPFSAEASARGGIRYIRGRGLTAMDSGARASGGFQRPSVDPGQKMTLRVVPLAMSLDLRFFGAAGPYVDFEYTRLDLNVERQASPPGLSVKGVWQPAIYGGIRVEFAEIELLDAVMGEAILDERILTNLFFPDNATGVVTVQ